jgi:predicted amidophosphoribosyltransferase
LIVETKFKIWKDISEETTSRMWVSLMVYCSNCGKELDDDANFCPKCGVRTEKGAKEGITFPWTYDPYWRREIDSALKSASNAIDEGLKVARESIKEATHKVEAEFRSARQSARQRTGPVYCSFCGQENDRSAKFCTKCGKEL